jgi:putative phage-type endonuclease
VIQGSQEWQDARLGKVTASRVHAVFTQPRKGCSVSKVRENYLADLLAERLTGKPSVASYGDDSDDGPAAWGKKTEPFARAAYNMNHTPIELAAFIDHPMIPMSGASPDGLVGTTGIVEIKCPNTTTHLETVRKGVVPTRHLAQIKWGLACTGRSWCDFISFDPRAEDEPFFCIRVAYEPDELRSMEMGVFAFVMELEARVAAHRWNEEEA